MKHLIILAAASLALCSCNSNTATKETIQEGWEVLIPSTLGYSGLSRYVDKKYGVVIYIGDNYRITSQKIGADK